MTLKLVDDGLAAKAKADAEALKKLAATEKDLKKFGAAGKHVGDLNKHLDLLAEQGTRLSAFKKGAPHVTALGQASRKARGDVAATAKALADLGSAADEKSLRRATRAHETALKKQTRASEQFAEALRAQRTARQDALGGRGASIGAAERKLVADTNAANRALREQLGLIGRINAKGAAERGLAGGMGGAGRSQLAAIEANRRLKDGMGRSGMPVVVPGGGAPEEPRKPRKPGSRTGGSHGEGGHSPIMGALGVHEMLKLGAGFTAYEAVKEAYHAQTHRQHEEVRQRASGMSEHEVAEGRDRAAELSGKYRAFSQTEIMHSLRNARSIMGHFEEAQQVMDPMLKLRTVALGAHPEKREELEADFDKLIKGMEIKGVTQNMGKFTEYMDGMAKALNVFGDTLRPTDYYEMFKYGRQATQGLSQDYMNTVAPTIAQELGGASGGVAHAAFFRAIVGGKMANNAAEQLMHIGLLDKDDLIINKAGSVKGIKPGHRVKGADEAQSNPYQWVQDVLVPALEKHGLTSPERMQETIGHIFSNQVAAQLVSMFATQQSRIEKDKVLVQGAGGLKEADRFQHEDPMIAWQSVKAQAENLAVAVGGFRAAAGALNATSEALAAATRLVEQGPGRAQAALDEHEAARKRGEDVMLAPSNIARLNDLLGDPDGNTSPEMAQARQEKLARDAIEAKRAQLDAEKGSRQQALDQLLNGSFIERMARRSIGQTPDGLLLSLFEADSRLVAVRRGL
ncbi:hypothetical protein MKK84_05850 [Methylobacterium sp. E-065]|uniref:hypothetical protein n=1 Tax=Methylobacterium sp. E-065 TaxID=2836583 RepID=UPI001FB8CDE6|nr:hypothetical protein [Methylobacterium sp. E-065]MCJ2016952.1 hypothetical protein [Methylobacterium sp. E-065]